MLRATLRNLVVGALSSVLAWGCDRAGEGDAPPAGVSPTAPVTTPAQALVAPVEAAPTPTEPPPRGFAIVRGGAELFSKPDASASIGKAPLTKITPSTDPALVPAPASGSVVAVVGAQGEFIAVETLVDGAQHCASGLGAWAGLRVGLFVRKSDLLQVTTRSVEHAFADGTIVAIHEGVPIGDDSSGAADRVVDGGGLGLEVPLPTAAIGTFYEPTARAPHVTTVERIRSGALAYGRGRPLGPSTALDHDSDGIIVLERRPAEDGRALVRVAARCADVWALVDAGAIEGETMRARGLYAMKPATAESSATALFGVISGAGEARTDYDIRAGAALSWPDGRAAGLAERAITSTHPPRREGTRSCLVVPLRYDETTGPELCVDAADLKTTEIEAVAEDPDVWGGLTGSEVGEPFGAGGLGLSGTGRSGGPGLGTIGGGLGAGKAKSKVKPGAAAVHGSLDKDIIRRVVRAHLSKVRFCYEKQLVANPSLAGKITVSFVIDPDGAVGSATVKDSTVANEDLESCVLTTVKAFAFPKPVGGGVVAVTYPFVFANAE